MTSTVASKARDSLHKVGSIASGISLDRGRKEQAYRHSSSSPPGRPTPREVRAMNCGVIGQSEPAGEGRGNIGLVRGIRWRCLREEDPHTNCVASGGFREKAEVGRIANGDSCSSPQCAASSGGVTRSVTIWGSSENGRSVAASTSPPVNSASFQRLIKLQEIIPARTATEYAA